MDSEVMQEEKIKSKQELIIIEQLPIITERLALLGKEIDQKISEATSLDCTEENKQTVKKARTTLSKEFSKLEERRKLVKKSIMTPYEKFEKAYKKYVTEKYTDADTKLKAKIEAVETEQKKQLKDSAVVYFNEYLASKNIDFVSFDNANIKIGIANNLTNLKKQVKAFIDKIADDVALIETQERKEEIFVEYKKSLNCSQAITTVTARHQAIEEQKKKQAELEASKLTEKEAVKKVEKSIPIISPPLERPIVESAKEVKEADPIKTLSFKVTAPLSKLKDLKKFLDDGGYQYE